MFKNAYLLMFSSIASAGSGFFFWLIVARFYSVEDIGLASAIVAVMGLISMISLLGFDISLIRFIPEKEDKNELINSCLTTTLIFSLAFALIFVVGIDIWSPSLIVIRENRFLLLLFFIFTAITPLTELQKYGIFVGFRKAEYSFIQTIIMLIRICIVPFLVEFKAVGIYASYGLMYIPAFLLGTILISKVYSHYKLYLGIKKEIINDIFHFSFGNHIARLFEELPRFILPIMIINVLGVKANAHFFIAWQISMLLLAVPKYTSISLLTESIYNKKELKNNIIRALIFISVILIVIIVCLFLFGKYLLLIFGKEYAKNSFEILLILAFGSIPFTFSALYATMKRIQGEIKAVIYIYSGVTIITLVASYILMQSLGLVGVGYAWVFGNGVIAGIIGFKLLKEMVVLPNA